MKHQSFPAWAPPDLVQYLESRSSGLESDAQHGLLEEYDYVSTELEVCGRLLQKPDMQGVWRTLRRRGKEWRPEHTLRLVREIALEKSEFPNRPELTNAKRRDSLLLIAQRAGELRSLLADAPEDVTPRDFAEIASQCVNVRQLTAWLSHEGLLARPLARRVALTVPRTVKLIAGGLGHEATTFQDALEHLASIATERAHSPELLGQQKTPNANALSLALRLNKYFVDVLGEPLHERVATIVNAVYDSELTRDNVKSAIRARDKRIQKAADERARKSITDRENVG